MFNFMFAAFWRNKAEYVVTDHISDSLPGTYKSCSHLLVAVVCYIHVYSLFSIVLKRLLLPEVC